MSSIAFRFLVATVTLTMGCPFAFGQFNLDKFEEDMVRTINNSEFVFHIDSYCRAASAYAGMEEDVRIERLKKLAEACDKASRHGALAKLCQILFARHERPQIGAPYRSVVDVHAHYVVAEPLIFYGNMPIHVARGYAGGGRRESNKEFLDLCLKNRKWATEIFDPSDQEKCRRLMQEFIGIMRHEITRDEEAYLMKQLP